MIDPDNITKRYYKIGEVAEMFGVTTSLIRYWESEFGHLKPMKSKSGIRRFQKEDILLIDKIYDLVKEKGYTLEGAKNVLKNTPPSSPTEKSKGLLKIKTELLNLRKGLVQLKDDLRKP